MVERLLKLPVFIVGLLVFCCTTTPATADEVKVRGVQGADYARLSFLWPTPVPFIARILERQLVIRFGRPLESNFAGIPGELSDFIGRPALRQGGRIVMFPLKNDFDLNYNLSGRLVTVDLYRRGPLGSNQSKKKQFVEPEIEADARIPNKAGAPFTEKLNVRVGRHRGHGRVVFDWNKKVTYQVEREADRATIYFDRPVSMDLSRVRNKINLNVGDARSFVKKNKTHVVLEVPASSRIRHFFNGNRVALDIFDPKVVNDSNKTMSVSGKIPQTNALPGSKQAPGQPRTRKEALQRANPAPPKKSINGSGQPVVLLPEARRLNNKNAKILPDLSPDTEASIRINWKEPVASAVYRRNGALWVVFDKKRELDLRSMVDNSNGILVTADKISAARGTFLKFNVANGFNPSIRRDGLAWIFDFKKQPLKPISSIEVKPELDTPSGPRLFLPVDQASQPIAFNNASVGNNLIVVPVLPLSHGINYRRTFPQLILSETAQGVVIEPKIDDLRVRSIRRGVEITSESKLVLSNLTSRANASAQIASLGSITRVFKPSAWRIPRRHGLDKFRQYREKLMEKIAATRGSKKQQSRQRLAEYYFAQNFGHEALGVLRLMVEDNPALTDDPQFLVLRGGSSFLVGRHEEAAKDLIHKALDDTDEGLFWRAANSVAQGKVKGAAKILKEKGLIIRSYPKKLKLPLGILIANTAIYDGDSKTANVYLQAISEEDLTPMEVDQLALIEGKLQHLVGNFDSAVEAWEATAKGEHRPSVVRAIRSRNELLLASKKITTEEVIKDLEGLQFDWRGGDFEFGVLRKISRYYLQANKFKRGLRALRSAATYFPGHALAPEVAEEMSDVFNELYLNDGADIMSPIESLGLFDEFKELTPSGEKGDTMIRKLADRLAQVDLLGRAAELLQRQVDFRLNGAEKAKVGARLATIRILNKEPELALAALQKSNGTGLAPQLVNERLKLQARALIDLERESEALAILKDDASRSADLLRNEVFWKAKKWPQSVNVLRRLVRSTGATPGKPLDERQALFVLNLGVALALAGFDTGSTKLMGDYGAAMDNTTLKDAFQLIASPGATGLVDFRSVAGKVKTVSNFKSFMAGYKERLKEGKLSQLN